ncbi:MAG: 4-alpha-glucanotransferase [Negativicutes bacterium]|nr:4-alpha-glucanotransferase [Negativicutes bacterium]
MNKQWLVHHSRQQLYRSPSGAVSCTTGVGLSLAVAEDRVPDRVILRTWREGHGEELLPLAPVARESGRVIYRAELTVPDTPGLLWYYFVVYSGGEVYYYGNNAAGMGGLGAIYETPPPSFQLTVYRPDAQTPDWFKHAVVYQIFVDRFYRGAGGIKNAKKGSLIHPYWDDDPVYVRERETGRILAYDFFGGDLAGVRDKLPYLKQLGVSAIYFNPIFESPSNHKYDTADYKTIDPMFGTNAGFAELCGQAAKQGMGIILDGVFSHTGSDSIYFNKEGHYPGPGAYQSKESPYFPWYRFSKYPDEYESWWGVDALPNVEEMEDSYREFIISGEDSVIKHWLRLGAKGWRLDVADELPDEFIRGIRRAMKEVDGDSVLIGEVWEDASRKESYSQLRGYLHGDELDSPTNYPFRLTALDFLLERQDAGATAQQLESLAENYPSQHFYAALNMIGSHDVPRILTLLGGHEAQPDLPYSQQLKRRLTPEERELALARLKVLVLWQMTFPGVPHVYYGDEAGLEGYTDPLNRRTFPWGREETALQSWYRKMIGLRNRHAVLRTGRWQALESHSDVLGYVRWIHGGRDVFGEAAEDNTAVILLNRSRQEVSVELDISRWCQGLMFDMTEEEREVAVADGRFRLTLPPLSGKLLLARLTDGQRTCGVLAHPTSLAAPDGCGGLGQEAHDFIDFLAAAGQNYWQILPLNPVGFGYSPYQSVSAFACEPLLIDINTLVADGLLSSLEVEAARRRHGIVALTETRVDFAVVRPYKEELFRQAAHRFALEKPGGDYAAFVEASRFWLGDYALYMALTGYFGTDAWNCWPETVAAREETALEEHRQLLADEIGYHCFLQYVCHRQWQTLRRHAADKGVRIIGDLPIFVAHHSADVWAHRELFKLDAAGDPTAVAGVPPDYFSATGQLWGNPLYRWREMAKDDYRWWRERITALLRFADIIRIDHFRGFEGYWEVPAGEATAENGRWVKGPGRRFFAALERNLGQLPLIAEDLGVITPAVTALRQKFGYPGMKVLQFSFRQGDGGRCEPLECGADAVVYTGTHDNDTSAGWYAERALASDTACVDQYLAITAPQDAGEAAWRLVELAYQCRAQAAVIPLQDLLGLGSEARMNTPGTVGDNWLWRCGAGLLTPELAEKLAALAVKHRRGV